MSPLLLVSTGCTSLREKFFFASSRENPAPSSVEYARELMREKRVGSGVVSASDSGRSRRRRTRARTALATLSRDAEPPFAIFGLADPFVVSENIIFKLKIYVYNYIQGFFY